MSFDEIILVGAILLGRLFFFVNQVRIGFLNSIFPATSATCVTGLTVLDTSTMISLFGKLVIVILIQIGGLGIIVLVFFDAFILGKKFSLKKMTLFFILRKHILETYQKAIQYVLPLK